MGRAPVIVLDTHVWVWWLSESTPLPPRVHKVLAEAMADRAMYVSSMSVWEVAQLVARGRLRLTMDSADWIAKSESFPFLHFVPMDNRIALKSVQLPGPLHTDPADPMIITTALVLGGTLITKDEKLLHYPHVKTFW